MGVRSNVPRGTAGRGKNILFWREVEKIVLGPKYRPQIWNITLGTVPPPHPSPTMLEGRESWMTWEDCLRLGPGHELLLLSCAGIHGQQLNEIPVLWGSLENS